MKTGTYDLGSLAGWTVADDSAPLQSGTLDLATDDELEQQRREGRDRTLDVRFTRFYEFLDGHVRNGVQRVVFEDVGFVSTRMQTQLWASLRSVIHVLQGERKRAKDNWSLGKFAIGFGLAPRGVPRVGVQFEIDANGILHVLARDTRTGQKKTCR